MQSRSQAPSASIERWKMLLSPQYPPVPPLHRHDHYSDSSHTTSPVASSSRLAPPPPAAPVLVPTTAMILNGTLQQVELADGRWKKYLCSHENCNKAFNRPGRLEEHLRSHSGEVSHRAKNGDGSC